MKKIILILFFLISCSTNKGTSNKMNSFDMENLFDLSVNQYKEMLSYYNLNNKYPNIDK